MSLKRLLVGSISLSDDLQADGENGGAGHESHETGGCQSSGTAFVSFCVFIFMGFSLMLKIKY